MMFHYVSSYVTSMQGQKEAVSGKKEAGDKPTEAKRKIDPENDLIDMCTYDDETQKKTDELKREI